MKVKFLIPLIVIGVVLATLVMIKRSNEPTVSIQDQTKLVPLVDESLDLSQVTRLEFFAGAAPNQRVVLVRTGDDWTMQSHYNAPVLPQRPNLILKSLAEFKGEFRATTTEEQLADYNLSNDRAFHIRGVNDISNTEVFHLLGGKTIKITSLLMRNAHSNTVYLINHNLRQGAYLGTDDYDEIPSPSQWLDKTIVDEPDAVFTKFELTMPDKQLVIEKQLQDGKSEWVVSQGGLEQSLQSEAIDQLSSRLKKLIGFQIISPDKSEIWGLDKPNYHLVAHRENGEPIELVVSHPSLTGPGYLQRLDNHNQQSYAFTVSNFFTLFVRGQELYSLPKIELASTPFTKMAYFTPDESIVLNLTEGKWALKGAGEDEKLNQNTVRQMTEALAVWQAGDYAASDTESGLSTPSYLITFTTESGTQSIKLGNESLHIKGRYAQLDDNPLILAMAEKDIQRIFLSKEDLLKEHSDAPATMNLTMPNLDQTPVAHGPDDGHNHPH